MINYFKLTEFCITNDPIPQAIADKILHNFIVPLNAVRAQIGLPIVVSKHAGWRPEYYELKKKRSGKSQHTFVGKGAADLYCHDLIRLGFLLRKATKFTRICYYYNNKFFHVDYKKEVGPAQLYLCDSPAGGWIRSDLRTFETYLSGSIMADLKLLKPRAT